MRVVAPVPPFDTPSVPLIDVSVVVDVQVGTPFNSARTWPGMDIDAFAQSIGLTRHDGEDSDGLASRCHYRIDDLMRDRAKRTGDHRLIELMDLHDAIERLVP